jgi:hypothetical protein
MQIRSLRRCAQPESAFADALAPVRRLVWGGVIPVDPAFAARVGNLSRSFGRDLQLSLAEQVSAQGWPGSAADSQRGGCYTSNLITVHGRPVGTMKRDELLFCGDSGWRFSGVLSALAASRNPTTVRGSRSTCWRITIVPSSPCWANRP